MTQPMPVLLSVRGLTTTFGTGADAMVAVDGIDFSIKRGEVVCLVGESGSGKSATAFSIMGLIDPPGHVNATELRFGGHDLLHLTEKQMNAIRGKDISLIFQEPMTALNPARTVGNQIAESLRLHQKLSRSQAWKQSIDWLRQVGIQEPERRANAYPHELSGGMRQRIMIAIACCLSPALIIADEPTTALDVTVQAQVLKLLFDIQARTDSAVLFITHDLGVVAEIADRVIVMQNGKIVEQADVITLFEAPRHSYTRALLAAVPDVTKPRARGYV